MKLRKLRIIKKLFEITYPYYSVELTTKSFTDENISYLFDLCTYVNHYSFIV